MIDPGRDARIDPGPDPALDPRIVRIEAAITRLGHADEPPRGWEAHVLATLARHRSRRHGAWFVPMLAVGAGLVLTASREAPDTLELVVTREHRGPAVRSDGAWAGDLLHITARRGVGPRAIWIYRNEIELVATCPGAPACRIGRDRTTTTLDLAAIGRYTVVALTSPAPLPVPHGLTDADLAAALTAGATLRTREVIVR